MVTLPDRSEGDINLTPRRQAWQDATLDEATRARLAEDARWFLHQSMSTPCLDALAGAAGSTLTTVDGRRLLDFHGNSLHQVGYGHPRVKAAVIDMLDRLPFSPRRFTNDTAVSLARRLCESAPGDLDKVLFAPGGTSAIGMALKLARVATGRHKTLSMWGSFHGASLDAISLGGEAAFRRGIGPLLPGAEHVPPCDPGDCPFGCSGRCALRCADYVDYVLEKEGDVAAVVVETIRCTDVQIPPADYYRRLRAACDRHGTLLILDEIPIALGRTGHLYAVERYGIVPDMLVLGKGLGGGLFPLAALLARAHLDVAGHISLGHYTHEKSPLACAAALATLDVLDAEELPARSLRLGEALRIRLEGLRAHCALIHEVRAAGLLVGIELRRPDGRPAEDEAEMVLYRCLSAGLSFKIGQGNVLVLAPPLNISDADLDRAFTILADALCSPAE